MFILKLKNYCLLLVIVIFLPAAMASDKKITPQEQQQYLIHVHKAMLYLADSLYQKACQEYEVAFSYRRDYAEDLFECTKAYDKLDNTEKTQKYLRMSVETGCDWWNYNNDQYLPNLKSNNKLPTVSELEQFRKTYFENLNIEYFLEIERLVARDQTVRRGEFRQRIDNNCRNTLIGITDSINLVSFKSLVEKYGYPEYSNAGHQGVFDAVILLMHGLSDEDSVNWAYFQPVLLNAVKNGQLMPDHYAILYDRVISHNGRRKQCYGMQPGSQIDDIENVDVRRKEIGLMPLGDEIKIYGGKAPDGYIRK